MSPPVEAAYIHVPFCIHRCGYCDFTVIVGRDDLLDVYLECLEADIRSVLAEPHPVTTLFIGGGTPNYLPAKQLERLFQILQRWLPLRDGGEYSIECNPEDFDQERMEVIAAAGVNRVSMGVQSFNQSHLKTLERGHSPETVAKVFENLRSLGFGNVSLDLIYAVPGQTLQDWMDTISSAIQLQPEHVSTYGLTYEKGTQFWTRRMKETLEQAEEELERSMYAAAMSQLSAAGFNQYELSNHSREGFACRHNQVYWNGRPYYGFGPGAAAYLGGERTTRYRSVTGWIKRIQAGESPISATEVLSDELAAREAVMLGLRQTAGIERSEYSKIHGCEIRDLAPDAFDAFIESGLLEIHEGYVRLTHAGRFLADSVVAEFL